MMLNDPALLAEMTHLHDAYEQALVANDVAALNAFFWDSPHVVRYGVSEQLYGTEDLHAYRQGPTPVFTDRRILRREVAAFGPAHATVMAEVGFNINGIPRQIRQSQTWVRLPDVGWRIVAAHVSSPRAAGSPWGQYAEATAGALLLPLPPEHRPGVVANLERTAAIVAPLLAFPLPDDREPASVFTP